MRSTIEQIKAFFPIQTGDKNTSLRSKCSVVTVFDDELADFCDILLELMYSYDGVGLAAPQVGQEIRIIATTQRKEEKKGRKSHKKIIGETAMVNPEIIDHSEDVKLGEEGCLSVPGYYGDVNRRTRIVVKYQDKHGKSHTQKYTGLSAVVIQHEIDHLDGILFTDKTVGDLRKITK